MQKSILITGCSSGIGYDCAHYLRSKGWRVFASCRQEADCARLTQEGFEAPQIDYADPILVARGASEVLDATGGTLDALFNNGAFALLGAVEDLPREGLRANFEVNLFGYHDLTRHVLPAMRAQGQGRILNCSSVLGIGVAKWRGAYNATKFALEALTDTLRMELEGTGIHATLIQPGPIGTDFRRNAIPYFEEYVDWQSSPIRPLYEATLLKRLYADAQTANAGQWPPRAVSVKVHQALSARSPASRYKVTTPTYVMAAMRRVLPRPVMEAVLARL